jgi:hypothetical protein
VAGITTDFIFRHKDGNLAKAAYFEEAPHQEVGMDPTKHRRYYSQNS